MSHASVGEHVERVMSNENGCVSLCVWGTVILCSLDHQEGLIKVCILSFSSSPDSDLPVSSVLGFICGRFDYWENAQQWQCYDHGGLDWLDLS